MKKTHKIKEAYLIGGIVAAAVVVAIVTAIVGIIIATKEDEPTPVITPNDDFTLVGIFGQSVMDEENYVFASYADYRDKFNPDKFDKVYDYDNSNVITAKDFENNNFVLIPMRYNSCMESNVTPTSYTIKDGNQIDILVEYEAKCGVCGFEYMYYLLKIDKSITDATINMEYEAINERQCSMSIDKPMIYLYPKTTTDISVRLGNTEYLTTTYPKYHDAWEVTARPDGSLIDKETGRELYGLYWEGSNHVAKVREDGFVVKGEDSIEFLEEKLSILGLTEREANEFIIYWLPKLEKNKYNYIRFETAEEIDNYMPLEVTPNPDSVIRISMDYKPLDEKITVEEQELVTPERHGFTVVEWGGSLIE